MTGGEQQTRHRPFRSWALQQDLISLLGAEPSWEAQADELGLEAESVDHNGAIRGQGFLRDQLQASPEFPQRTNTSVTLWATALLTDCINQWGPTGIKMGSSSFAITVILLIFALIFTPLVYPRLRPRVFVVVEQIMLTLAFAMIAFQCSVTGGAESPYSVWLMFTVFYAAYFMPRRQVFLNSALTVAIAFAPFVYQPSQTEANTALFAAMLAVIACLMAFTIFYRREFGRAAERGVKFLALADSLTNVANLRAFDQFAERLAKREDRRFAIAMVDMNGLKGANTVFGYDVGDGMVVRLARLMQQVSSAESQVARIGGDEFAVLLPRADAAEVDNWRVSFDAAVTSHNERIRGRMPQISVATGTAVFPDDGTTADELIDAADRRMYEQKSPAVTPPHVIDDATPVIASRLLQGSSFADAPRRSVGPKEYSTQAGSMWLLVGLFVLFWPAVPGADVPYPRATIALGAFCMVISAIAFIGRRERFRHIAWRISDIATLSMAAPGLWLTGGWQSPFQLAGILVVAYYSQFYRGAEAIARCATVIGLYTLAFWTSGVVSPAGQSLFAVVVTAEIVIGFMLQLNARVTDDSLAVIRDSATHDALTGVNNLYAFRNDLAAAVDSVDSDQEAHLRRPALILVDLDDFRHINTRAGHLGGDAILREAARRLDTAAAGEGAIYRIGGDEFAILFRVDRISEAANFAGRCRRALDFRPPEHLNVEGQVRASVGFSVLRDEMSGEGFVSAVEAALAESKTKRGDSVGADTNVLL